MKPPPVFGFSVQQMKDTLMRSTMRDYLSSKIQTELSNSSKLRFALKVDKNNLNRVL
eukprot:m.213249 g.213249  ORF g.213249 m.213249 type:complete len:57 (-) comp15859_c0_seq18:1107-1277(-)